jgi:hypothetical protein
MVMSTEKPAQDRHLFGGRVGKRADVLLLRQTLGAMRGLFSYNCYYCRVGSCVMLGFACFKPRRTMRRIPLQARAAVLIEVDLDSGVLLFIEA